MKGLKTVTDMLLMLLILGAVNHRVTHILTVGVVFQDFRDWTSKTFGHESKLAYLVRCHLCAGSWFGFLISLVAHGVVTITREPVSDFLLVSFAIALVGRIFNERLAIA